LFHVNVYDFSCMFALLPISQPKMSGQSPMEPGSMGVYGQRRSSHLLSLCLFLVVLARLHARNTGELQLGAHNVLRHTSRCLHTLVTACTAHIRTTERRRHMTTGAACGRKHSHEARLCLLIGTSQSQSTPYFQISKRLVGPRRVVSSTSLVQR
jgi:hypothetical protein